MAIAIDELHDLIDRTLEPWSFRLETGEDYKTPPLDVRRYHHRAVRISWVPWLGRGRSVVALIRQPPDLKAEPRDHHRLLERVARAVTTRFPPSMGSVVGLVVIVLTAEPIAPDEEDQLKEVRLDLPRSRVVPLGLIRLNLVQEAMATAHRDGPAGLFPEAGALAEAFSRRFGRFLGRLPLE
ncbi:hypothetical protein Isop_1030 [Isosphaera pallida ATCC 43644]|jgi:hypothetical protein|uniref:Uncharacterized protein n=1 Tax=Isosphaera pallida (strain ATCC 43644 / DSM 9630 / IS1B) TaxID=575540 RepID=E8R432_ISOPI|nr:hypothetical protein [Isosphaera pallida]ADV61619.1 hypothetical protein Isop_1030 [Isosphaera pallida ATCC 43644]